MTHAYGVPLIVDEAHGAHLGFDPYFPENSNIAGADVVVQSVHKTLPSLTQTALLHINGPYVKPEKIRKYLGILQSSSPSYILMASIDACVDLMEKHGKELCAEYAKNLRELREKLRDDLKVLKMVQRSSLNATYDPSKIVISVRNAPMGGHELYDILLNKYHLQMEMAAGSYVLAMTSLADTKEGFDRLYNALVEIDQGLERVEPEEGSWDLEELQAVCTIAEIEKKPETACERIPLQESEGCVSREYVYVYPPGVPLIVPGERIDGIVLQRLAQYEKQGFVLQGLEQEGLIEVWKDE
jgi:arginine/lysine/ornithine decarboxylase